MRNTILVAGLLFGLTVAGHAQSNNVPPSEQAIAFAVRTADLLTNTLVAALLQEIDETTPDNVAEGNQSIGLVFSDSHSNFRLVGRDKPLSDNDYPQDAFEDQALTGALAGSGTTSVERVLGRWYYRRSIPLQNFATQCAMCHANFVGLPATAYVGALMLKVPVPQE